MAGIDADTTNEGKESEYDNDTVEHMPRDGYALRASCNRDPAVSGEANVLRMSRCKNKH